MLLGLLGGCNFFGRNPKEEKTAANSQKENEYISTLEYCRDCFDSLLELQNNGFQLLGVEQLSDASCLAVVAKRETSSSFCRDMDIHMYELPRTGYREELGKMFLSICRSKTVRLIDWWVEKQNQGYGSILMKHALSFLQTMGIQYITGSITPRDYDHLDLLLHFYQKFGFEIRKFPDHHALKLYLFPADRKSEQGLAADNASTNDGGGIGQVQIKLHPAKITLSPGQSTTISPEILLENQEINDTSFFSQRPEVASVDDSGKITAISEGVTNIVFHCGEIGASCLITVIAPAAPNK